MDKITSETVGRRSVEELFQRLPPLGSEDYLQYLRKALALDLPAEVLARAFRQLPPETLAARATLERLFNRLGERWEYLGPLAARARRRAASQQSRNRADEDRDLLQDAITKIYSLLPTARGELAERAWSVFCRNAFEDAWRERYGRRGERLGWVRESWDRSPTEIDEHDLMDTLANDKSPWRVIWDHDHSERIEAIVTSVMRSIQDPFEQEVAQAVWSAGRRPKTSGAAGEDRDPPLTVRFPGKSRHQINRALRHLDSRLAAALLVAPSLDWSEDELAFLRLQESRGKQP